jgi:hypothetical protein
VLVAAGTAGASNGRGQKRDNTKQTTLFGLPAVPVPATERPEKRSRKKGGAAVPSEDSRVAEPETMESSQDVEMTELQDVTATQTSQEATATAVDSQQQESQAATELTTTQVKRVSPVYAVLKLTNDVQEDGSPEPIDWPPTPPPMENNLPDEICTN